MGGRRETGQRLGQVSRRDGHDTLPKSVSLLSGPFGLLVRDVDLQSS